jgi:hypothetical protein
MEQMVNLGQSSIRREFMDPHKRTEQLQVVVLEMTVPRVVPWVIAVLCAAACGLSLSELQRVKTRLGDISRHSFHDHADVRQFMIMAALADVDQPIVVVGDSITEMAPLPSEACGHPVINAGIGGFRIDEYAKLAPRLFISSRPFLIVSALGANDIGSNHADHDYADLLRVLSKFSQRIVSVSVTSDIEINQQILSAATDAKIPYVSPQLPPGSKMPDSIHYTAAAYRAWIPAVQSAILKECG